jgi:hypothetical protein
MMAIVKDGEPASTPTGQNGGRPKAVRRERHDRERGNGYN